MHVKRLLVVSAVVLLARTAHAIPYESFIDVDDEGDLQDLLASGEITQDTFDELIDLLDNGVDLNGVAVLSADPSMHAPHDDCSDFHGAVCAGSRKLRMNS